jgi:membrane protease YdiL (CAAX protease family)
LSGKIVAKIPTPLQAGAMWISAGLVMAAVSTGFAALASMVSGVDASLLADPEQSPILANPRWVAIGTMAVEFSLLCTTGAWVWMLKPSIAHSFPIRFPELKTLAGALLLVFGLMPVAGTAAELTYRLVGEDLTASEVVARTAQRASLGELVLLIHALAFAPALAEEVMFRGIITAPFAARSALAAVVLPSLMFGIFHLEPTQVAGTTILGMGFGLTRWYSGSLLPSTVAHCLYNTSVVLMLRHEPDLRHTIEIWPILTGIPLAWLGIVLLRGSRPPASPKAHAA